MCWCWFLCMSFVKQYVYFIFFIVILNQIPLVTYTEKELLEEVKEDRLYHSKWKYSLVVFDKDLDKNVAGTDDHDNSAVPIAVVLGYEREAEGNEQYPVDTICLSGLGVAAEYQRHGIGKKLVSLFLDRGNKLGFLHLSGKMNFTVQTDIAEGNKHVRELYESFGFTERATKEYDLRVDVVLCWQP
jgi:GNAT superfamily N-acetyltransferase